MKDSEHTFFGLGDYREQKKREKDAPYDNISMSHNDGVEVKVNSFTCFQPNKNLESSPVVCPSLLQWAEYLLTPAMETDEQKKERLHKLGEKPMKRYIMTHTTMKSRLTQENTANVVTTSSENTANVDTTTVLQQRGNTTTALQQRGNITFLETLAEAITTPNDSAEEEPTSVMLLYRIGEALQAAERTHDSISLKRKPPGFVYNEARVKGGIASFVQLVQSINKEDNQVDFAAAMDWLERESKTGNSLIIDLTRPGDDDSSSDDSSASSEHNSDDSDYMEGGGDSKPRHKKRTSHNKQKTPDKGNSPDNGQANLNILSSVCGDIIDEESNDDKEEISVNESNKSNTNIPNDLFHGLYGKSLNNEEVEDEGVKDGQQHQDNSKDGQQHQDNSGGLEEKQVSDQSLQSLTESQQDDMLQIKGTDGKEQPDQDGSGGLEKRQESQQLHSPGKTGEDTLSKSQKKRWRKKERKREMRNREQEEDQDSDHESNRNNQEEDSADEVEKQRKKKKKKKKQSSDGI